MKKSFFKKSLIALILFLIAIIIISGINLFSNTQVSDSKHLLAEDNIEGNYCVWNLDDTYSTYLTLQDAINSSDENYSIEVLKDTYETSSITINDKYINLNLAGHKLYIDGNIEINNSVVTLWSIGYNENDEEINVDGDIVYNNTVETEPFINVKNNSEFIINYANIDTSNCLNQIAISCTGNEDAELGTANLSICGGEIKSYLPICLNNNSDSMIEECTIGNNSADTQYGVLLNGGTLTISDEYAELSNETPTIYGGIIKSSEDNGSEWNFNSGIIYGSFDSNLSEYVFYNSDPAFRSGTKIAYVKDGNGDSRAIYLVEENDEPKLTVLIPTAETGLIYNGTEQTGVIESNYYTLTNNKGTNAGEYTATATLSDAENTQWIDGTSDPKNVSFSISKKTIGLPNVDSNNLVYNGEEQTGIQVAESQWYTVTGNKGTNAGTYTANIALTDKVNTQWSDETSEDKVLGTFEITKKTIEIPTAIEELVYTGEEQTGVSEGEYYTISGNKGTNAGTYTATATLADTNNMQWSDGTSEPKEISYSISAKTIQMPAVFTITTEYTGAEQTGIQVAESQWYTVTGNKGTNAGTYTAYIALTDKVNTKWTDGTSEDKVLGTFEIEKKKIEKPEISEIENFEYTGEEIEFVNLAESQWYTITGDKGTNAGTYTVHVILKDKDNTSWDDETTEDIEIGPIQITKKLIAIPTGVELAYNGEEQTGVEETQWYSVTGNKATEAGEYEATATLKDKDNTQWSDNTTDDKKIEWSIIVSEIEIIEDYVISEDLITNIQPKTNFEDFKSKIRASQEYEVVDGEEPITESDTMKTGQILVIGNKEYTIVVAGDANGDGKSEIRDIIIANRHRYRTPKLEGAYFTAADVVKDGVVDIRDIIKMNSYRRGKITSF